jgi:hypothetical protein
MPKRTPKTRGDSRAICAGAIRAIKALNSALPTWPRRSQPSQPSIFDKLLKVSCADSPPKATAP